MSETFVTLAQRPDLAGQARALTLKVWAEFLRHDAVCNRYWRLLYNTFARFQVVLCDPADMVIAAGHTIPLVWDGTQGDLPSGLDDVLERGVRDAAHHQAPTTLSALAAMVAPSHQRRGLSAAILQGDALHRCCSWSYRFDCTGAADAEASLSTDLDRALCALDAA
jgi:hypothetical protein